MIRSSCLIPKHRFHDAQPLPAPCTEAALMRIDDRSVHPRHIRQLSLRHRVAAAASCAADAVPRTATPTRPATCPCDLTYVATTANGPAAACHRSSLLAAGLQISFEIVQWPQPSLVDVLRSACNVDGLPTNLSDKAAKRRAEPGLALASRAYCGSTPTGRPEQMP